MPRLPQIRRHHRGFTLWRIVLFLAGFGVLLAIVLRMYIAPAAEVITDENITDAQRRQLGAYSWLLLAILMVILFAGLLLTFRFGRYFTGKSSAPSKTDYPDAWAESGRRMKTPPIEDDETA